VKEGGREASWEVSLERMGLRIMEGQASQALAFLGKGARTK